MGAEKRWFTVEKEGERFADTTDFLIALAEFFNAIEKQKENETVVMEVELLKGERRESKTISEEKRGCQVLDKGKRCRREATRKIKIFGDTGPFGRAVWVLIHVCDQHHEELKEPDELVT